MTASSNQKHWDLFISYAKEDREWVEGFLLDALRGAGITFHTETAFEKGTPLLDAFEQAVRHSRRTLLILSPAYLSEHLGRFVEVLAQTYGLETNTWPVIPLRLRHASLPSRLAMLVSIDATQEESWEMAVKELADALGQPVAGPEPIPPPPYPTMRAFSRDEGHLFFGREADIEYLVNLLRTNRFLTIVGPSGSGKSSLVFAGLIPALVRSRSFGAGDWIVRSLQPGNRPLEALQRALGGESEQPEDSATRLLVSHAGGARLLIYVDQFEEIFTLAEEDPGRFQQALRRLAVIPKVYIALTVRSDFYPELKTCELWPEIRQSNHRILSLDEHDLGEAIARPAEEVRVHIESALVERLLADAGNEPGVLPYIGETMVRLWDHIERRYLPFSAYETLVVPRSAYAELGEHPPHGLSAVVAMQADTVFKGLSSQAQPVARRILLRLTQFGAEDSHSRRQLPVSRCLTAKTEKAERGLFNDTFSTLTQGRLLTLSGAEEQPEPLVDLAHSALIQAWLQHTNEFDQYRVMEEYRRRVEADADGWHRTKKKEYLYLGGKLNELDEWRTQWPEELTTKQEEFFRQSQEYHKTRRITQILVAIIVVLCVLALTIYGVWYNSLRLRARGPVVEFPGGSAVLGRGTIGTEPLRVDLSSFSIDKHEVSIRQYGLCVKACACSPPQRNGAVPWYCPRLKMRSSPQDAEITTADLELPVAHVTAFQAAEFCHWIGRNLPTEAQWERAARGSDGRPYPWEGPTAPKPELANLCFVHDLPLSSDEPPMEPPDPESSVARSEMPSDPSEMDAAELCGVASLRPVSDATSRAGSTPEGIAHMLGNVWEWTRTPAQCEKDPYRCETAWDQVGLVKTSYYLRGGSYLSPPILPAAFEPNQKEWMLTTRVPADPNLATPDIGFRCAVSLER